MIVIGAEKQWPDRESNPGPLSYRASTELPSHLVDRSLIRFVPECARNNAGTDETDPVLLTARAQTHTKPHQQSQKRRKNVAWPERESRTSRLPCEHFTTELSSHLVDLLHNNENKIRARTKELEERACEYIFTVPIMKSVSHPTLLSHYDVTVVNIKFRKKHKVTCKC